MPHVLDPEPNPLASLLGQTAFLLGQTADTCARSTALILAAQRTRSDGHLARHASPVRRCLRLATGGSGPQPEMNADGALIVRAKLALGRLRRDPCFATSVVELGGHHACQGCDRAISSLEAEMRVRFADGASLRFHAPCFTAWHTETQRARKREV